MPKPVRVQKSPKKPVAIQRHVGKGDAREVDVTTNPNIEDGVSPRSKLGKATPKGKALIGTSLGVTLNMGDYESARVDVFIQRHVDDDDESIKEGLAEISELLHEELQNQALQLSNED